MVAFCKTIRGRILVAFLVMSLITAALGYYATLGIKDAGVLVDKTYDQSLMSINYARAAAADFAAMRAAFARRWIESEPANRDKLDQEIKALATTLSDDLGIAVQRSQSDRARRAAANVRRAADNWLGMSGHLLDQTRLDASWEMLDTYAHKVDEQIDLLINYTAGDGFVYRQSARAAVARDINLNIAGTVLALLLSGMVAWALTGRIIKPVAAASSVAEHIAGGRLDVAIPNGSADEIGDLLGSMKAMRDNIKAMMDREVAQRRTAQARLADALESSQEGVVVVDAEDRIALANAQAASFLGLALDQLKAGSPLAELWPALQHSIEAGRILRRQNNGMPEEIGLPDGRWLRVSQSATRDGGFIAVCSDISQSKEQKARLRQTNLRLDAALDNMSQGLCLYDAENKLQVMNRRFRDIFGLTSEQLQPGMTFMNVLEL
ncbi:MAG: PAS-domain containing protein, partial [Bradyrhizobium sp.]